MSDRKLTGKTRFRLHDGLLVLQVQETWLEDDCCGGFVDVERVYDWRDARVEDVTTNVVTTKVVVAK